jgi:DNA primase
MINVDKLIELADGHIEEILTTLGLEYKYENDWVALRCMFHDGDGFNLKYRDKNFYCFSQCRRNYSIIHVVQKTLDLEFKDAVSWLCNQLNIQNGDLIVDENKLAIKSKLRKLKTMKVKKDIIEYKKVPQNILNDIDIYAHPYLLKQGFRKQTLEHFNIGYARGGEMINRVVFPIDSPNGDIIALSGRLPNATELGLPKYKILEGTKKSYTLYNISRAMDSIKEKGYVILVEGFKSCMALYELDIENVVACMGSSISSEQRKILLSLGVPIVVIGDADEAGRRMAQSVYNQCYRFTKVEKIDLSEFTDKDKASVDDLDFDEQIDLINKIEEVM